jgi:hypothetical protein
MIPGNAVFKVCLFLFTRCDDAVWLLPAKRSTNNSRRFRRRAMDENKRAIDIVFPGIMGIKPIPKKCDHVVKSVELSILQIRLYKLPIICFNSMM